MAPNSNQIYDVMEQKGWHTITSKQLSGLEYNLIIVDEFVNPSFDLTEEEKEMLDSTFTKNTKKDALEEAYDRAMKGIGK